VKTPVKRDEGKRAEEKDGLSNLEDGKVITFAPMKISGRVTMGSTEVQSCHTIKESEAAV